MTRWQRITIALIVFAVAGGIAAYKRSIRNTSPNEGSKTGMPRLLELGSTTCTQCKMMKKVVANLRRNYPDSLQTDFIDVAIHPDAGHAHGIRMIPTQIFFDADGNEFHRHEGFLPEEAVVTIFSDHGHDLGSAAKPGTRSLGLVEGTFVRLTHALEDMIAVALMAALIWGALSVLLSPCHLTSIPLIVGFINDGETPLTTGRAFRLASCFAVGLLVTISILGTVTSLAGRLMGEIGLVGATPVVVVFLVMGLHLVGVIPLPINGPGQLKFPWRGGWAALVLGLVFGIALGPCTFAFMAPVLALVFKLGAAQPFQGAALLTAYGLGYCGVIILAGTFTGALQHYLNWTGESKVADGLKRLCGTLVVLGGFFLIWKTF